ncbi:peptide ABC transporter substrate-binding protein [Corynebacterium freiburgense]|uniref:peptide ABC transporter substrate-binding protein n=1 Tax=Corynebacterium freiburgense TaxID=556548 RepID=UPI0003F986F6|nr:ABC transporter substrate-binding protein [Corynebacterium freiburgense]WJZ02252.1 Oligopeptide-binding protein OppA precursor [Corynebacterium freiburgense]
MAWKKTLAVTAATALTFGLAACSNDSGSGGATGGANYITVYGSEPQNPLHPANTNETGGGNVIDVIFAGLSYYDSDGKIHNEVAKSVELEGEKTYKVTLKDDQKFSDGTQVKADNFVKAWNYAVENSWNNAHFFESIKGFEEGKPLEGLKVIDDKTFTIELTQPEADFPLRLGYSAFFPLPDVAFEDMEAFGEKPVGNGPFKVSEWNHNQDITLEPNGEYKGDRQVQNDGVKFVFYPKLDAAYADLLAGNLDVLDTVPESAFANYQEELGDRWVNQPAAVFQSFTIPEKLEHFSGEEGKLRREAISLAINRKEITEKIFQGTRTPATDFTSPVIDGHTDSLKGEEVLEYNPEKAKELWAKADAMNKFTGEFSLAYNADGGHQPWVDAVVNSIKNVLGIEAVGAPYPDFKSFRDDITNRTIGSAFRTGWQGDYPGLGNFLVPLYATGGSSNDGDYSNAEVDALFKKAAGADSVEESTKIYNEAQEVLLKDLPAIPTWYSNVTAGWSENVENVKFNWKSKPELHAITKK